MENQGIYNGRASTTRNDRGREGRKAFPSSFCAKDGSARADRAAGRPDAGLFRRQGPDALRVRVQADQARRRWCAEAPVVAGCDLAQPALRGRHQGSGRLAHLLRAAGRMGPRRRARADAGRRDPDTRERRSGGRRHVGRLEAETRGPMARRQPFTADDVVFNYEYTIDPATATVTIGSYQDVKVDKIDDYAVRVRFPKATPFWADAFVGTRGMIIPKHLFADYIGAKSRDAPTNLKPVGTGPYKFVDFKPGDMVRGEINHELPPAQPALLRQHRDEGRRRRRLGGARRDPDRANMTTPGTCRWRTRSCFAWRRAARAGPKSLRAAISSTSS